MCKDLLCNKALYVQGRVCRKLYRSEFLTLCIEFHYKHRKVLYIEEQFRTKIEERQNAQISGLASNSERYLEGVALQVAGSRPYRAEASSPD